MNNEIYTEPYTVSYSDCDRTGLAKLPVLAALLQDIAMRHDLIINKTLFDSDDTLYLFALLRSNLTIHTMPRWRDEISVSTWLHPLEQESRFLYRSFIFYNNLGEEIGYCTITAFYIDLVERKAKELPVEVKLFPTLDRSISTAANSRIKRPKSVVNEVSATVLPDHIDMYDHVNNNHYLCWAIDFTPIDIQLEYYCCAAETQFRMELQEGQEFLCKTEINETENGLTALHQIVHESDSKEISRLITLWKKR